VLQEARAMLTKNKCGKLSLAYWNVDGLYKRIDGHKVCKFDDVDLQSKLNLYDIVCLVETHCGRDTVLQLPGYQIFQNTRERSGNAKRDYGGIAICIKSHIRDGVKILQSTSSEVMWIKLLKTFFNLERDIYVAAVYVSPESSPYSARNDDVFDILENQVAQYSSIGDCFVCGDFNARTCREPDYCVDDDSPVSDLCSDYITDVPMCRNNTDPQQVNSHGKNSYHCAKLQD
jgi:exonuclease III